MTKRSILLSAAFILMAAFCTLLWKNRKPQHDLSYDTFQSKIGWGYNILVDHHVWIHQEMIPVLALQKGFASRQQAEDAAGLVLRKIRMGQLPTLSENEIRDILLPDE